MLRLGNQLKEQKKTFSLLNKGSEARFRKASVSMSVQHGFRIQAYLIERSEAPPQSAAAVSHQGPALRPALILLIQQQVLQTFLRGLLMKTRQFVNIEPKCDTKKIKTQRFYSNSSFAGTLNVIYPFI